jgi:spermidine synthase
VIMGDAYRSLFSIPFHLVSEEAIGLMESSLTENGVLMMNILSPAEGENQELLFSLVKTCRRLFPEVRAFRPYVHVPASRVQNIMLVCRKGKNRFSPAQRSQELAEMLAHEMDLNRFPIEKEGLVLTDDFAPVEHFAEKMLSSYFR